VNRAARSLAVLAAGAALFLLARYWPHVRNEFFVLLGSRNEAGGWYGFHSGLGGAAYITIGPALLLWYWHHTCHASPWCLRIGKYEAAAGVFKLCARHHPDLDGTRPHLELIHRLHREHLERGGR
jgi:hypothetical protein